MVQNKIAEAKIRTTPAAAPPSGVTQYTNLDGMIDPMVGTSNLAGAMYAPTASNKGAAASDSAPKAIAATIPTTTDLSPGSGWPALRAGRPISPCRSASAAGLGKVARQAYVHRPFALPSLWHG